MTVTNNLNLIEGEIIENEFQFENESFILSNKRFFYVNNENGEHINNPYKNISSVIANNSIIRLDNTDNIQTKGGLVGLTCAGLALLWFYFIGDLGDTSNSTQFFVVIFVFLVVFAVGLFIGKIIFAIIYNNQKKEYTSFKVILKDGNLLINKLYETDHLQKLKILEKEVMKKIINL